MRLAICGGLQTGKTSLLFRLQGRSIFRHGPAKSEADRGLQAAAVAWQIHEELRAHTNWAVHAEVAILKYPATTPEEAEHAAAASFGALSQDRSVAVARRPPDIPSAASGPPLPDDLKRAIQIAKGSPVGTSPPGASDAARSLGPPSYSYVLQDTQALLRELYSDLHGLIVLVDPARPETWEIAQKLMARLPRDIPGMVLLNFADRDDAEVVVTPKTVSEWLAQTSRPDCPGRAYVPPVPAHCISVSLKNGYGLSLLKDWSQTIFAAALCRIKARELQAYAERLERGLETFGARVTARATGEKQSYTAYLAWLHTQVTTPRNPLLSLREGQPGGQPGSGEPETGEPETGEGEVKDTGTGNPPESSEREAGQPETGTGPIENTGTGNPPGSSELEVGQPETGEGEAEDTGTGNQARSSEPEDGGPGSTKDPASGSPSGSAQTQSSE